jgi:signal transduction histidine kinase
MTPLGIRARFALLTAALVLAISALVGVGGYVTLRHALYSRAQREANDQARQLAALVDVGREGGGQGNQVDPSDPSLVHGFTGARLLVSVLRPDGARIQAAPGAPSLPEGLRATCARAGSAERTGHLALACARVGPARHPAALMVVGAPLGDARDALAQLARALVLGVAAGTLLAALIARAVAQHQRRLIADASHELRTPLAAIQAHVELLRGWASERPADRDAALAALEQASRAAGRLGGDLLYLAQIDRAPLEPRLSAQLDQIVVDGVREARALRPQVGIRISRLDEGRLVGDELALRRLLVNLLANALRVSPADGELTVALAVEGTTATVTVSDDGPGIAPDQLERIFQRSYTTLPRRSGLGLAIVRDIARRHGGDVHASNRPNGGAAFVVELPLTEPASRSP